MPLGPHIIQRTAAGDTWARVAKIVKALDDPSVFELAPDDAIRVFRVWVSESEQETISPEAYATRVLLRLGGYRHRLLVVELLNEKRDVTVEWVLRAVLLLHRAGLKVAGPGSWATGDYDLEDFHRFRQMDWCGLDMISLHCYHAGARFTLWNALRYRQFWRTGDPPIVITETGRDRVRDGDPAVNDGWIGNGGWKADGISAEDFAEELRAYDAEISQDSYVLGATVFTCGPTDRWKDFDADPVVEHVLRWPTVSNENASVHTPPVVESASTTGRELPAAVVTGRQKAEQYIGPYTGVEISFGPNVNGEIGEYGWFVWDGDTNETIMYVREGQQVWADDGNLRQGVLRRIR